MQREFPSQPLAGVGGIVVCEGRILLIQRGTEPMKGRWTIPGGLVELGESLEDAVRREVLEETGLQVEPLRLVELLDRVHREGERVRYHFIIADYLCRVTAGHLQAASDAAGAVWVRPEDWSGKNPLVVDPITARVLTAAWTLAADFGLR